MLSVLCIYLVNVCHLALVVVRVLCACFVVACWLVGCCVLLVVHCDLFVGYGLRGVCVLCCVLVDVWLRIVCCSLCVVSWLRGVVCCGLIVFVICGGMFVFLGVCVLLGLDWICL